MPHETLIRLSFFIGIFVLLIIWEFIVPRRNLEVSKTLRWKNNLYIIIINTVLLRLLFPVAAVGVAVWCSYHSVGFLNIIFIPEILKIIVAFLILDFAIYLQHIIFHYIPIFWKFHKVHHADQDIDVTTGLRFHPIEIVLSMLIKFAVVVFVGAPVIAVIVFEVVLNATAMFNHSNIRLPKKIDAFIRFFIVTPDMHRVHHSTIVKEANSNFGFNFAIWDRLFGTYIAQPRKGHLDMDIGLDEYRDSRTTQKLINMLKMPFLK